MGELITGRRFASTELDGSVAGADEVVKKGRHVVGRTWRWLAQLVRADLGHYGRSLLVGLV
jgi:hypothetical protein